MQAVFQHLDLRLERNQSFVLSRAAAAAILVQTGSVWVTRDGDRADHVLAEGQRMTVGNDGAVVVLALRGARVSVDAPRRAHGPLSRLARGLKASYLRGMRRLAGRHAPHVCESIAATPRAPALA